MQQVMCSSTLVLGLFLAMIADGELAVFGWFVAALGLLGVLLPVLLTRVPRRGP